MPSLLRLDQTNPAGRPLVNYINIPAVLVPEDVEVVVHVVKREDCLSESLGLREVEGFDLCDGGFGI